MEVQKLAGGQFKLADDPLRPAGLHQGDIINDIMKELDPGRYAKKGPDGELLPMDMVKVESGVAFEKALETAFCPASPGAFRPQPVFMPVPGTVTQFNGYEGPGGIWCSPDSIDPDCSTDGDLVVREFKLTWYSKKKQFPHDKVYWPYLVQVKGYCRAIGTLYAILTIMHVNGDYAPPTPHEPDNYGLVFTGLELEENWAMLVNHARLRRWLVDG